MKTITTEEILSSNNENIVLFKSDDDAKISTETEDVVVTEEVIHISN